ncbi:ABC transporter ATP-binding protein [Intestinibacter bartlettii]|uniref:ABC transporter ATP-binding protein/permease n=1 Tax=Intestinibacter bartlettii TaxID=261299 RepID=A0ABS6DY62_9FIRM|nr:ABC transporter ATP-binding protein [Intestinibacter bartlettii]MBU5336724.1 ABC transporter ATP-binding protein/permease [Intestinibacter bartlettii]MDO5010394.1 ABC transporter ATP-binding protein [Intestinibacter bartlettii]
MTKLFKYLKQSWVAIFTILILLGLQATTELSLPTYTSNIVNVGIQQSGIENATIKAIRESEMDKLTTFMNDSDKKKVLDNYKLVNKDNLSTEEFNNYKEEYPIIKNESLYVLNTKDKDTIEKLSDILAKPMLIVYNLENSSEGNKLTDSMMSKMMGQNNMAANQANMDMSQMAKFMDADGNLDMFAYINAMPKEQKEEMLSKMDDQFVNLPEAMLDQGAITFVKAEYTAIGVDTDSLQMNYIFMTGLKMIGLTIISVICSVTVGFIAARVAATLGKNLRAMTFKKVMNFSKKEISEFSTASLITRSTNDIQQIQQMMVMMLRMVFFAPFMAIGGIIKALNTNLSMSWIIALGVVCVFGIVLVMFTVVMPKFKILQNLVDRLNLVTREILTGLGVIRAFSNEKFEEERFDVANKDLTKVNMFVNRMMSCMMPAMMLIMNLISILIVWVGAKNVDLGTIQVGDMMAFIQYTMQIVMSFLMISMISVMMPRAAVSANRIDEVLTTDISIKEADKVEEFDNDKKGLVEFKNVSFKYPDADEKILHDISFTAKPGQTTAFIGSTGSGKSTLINLIPRFYDVTEGEIKVDGVNVKNASIHDLRERIGYVPQKGVLFSGTIDSNIKYGNKTASEEVVETASRVAQATEFIDSKPDRYETPIAQGGSNVSGGQKQRLSIARAIAKEPEIYIFDDSFSALDFKTDAKLRKALKEETGDATVLIVAQRISTILHAEQIVVLDEGKVVGIGNHKQLLKNCEVYKEIALSQLSKEELENE